MSPILCRFIKSITTHKHTPFLDRKQDIMSINRPIGEYNHSLQPSRYNISIAPAKLHTYGVTCRKNLRAGRPRWTWPPGTSISSGVQPTSMNSCTWAMPRWQMGDAVTSGLLPRTLARTNPLSKFLTQKLMEDKAHYTLNFKCPAHYFFLFKPLFCLF